MGMDMGMGMDIGMNMGTGMGIDTCPCTRAWQALHLTLVAQHPAQ